MYLNSNTTFVEVNKPVPIHFRLDKHLIGMDAFKVYLQNKEKVEIIELENVEIKEYNQFKSITTLVGPHLSGIPTLKVADTAELKVGDVIRFDNTINTIVSIDRDNHIITLDGCLCDEFPDGYPVVKVVCPDFLGCYWCLVKVSRIGNYMLHIVDQTGTVPPITDDLQVLASLASTGRAGMGTIINNKATIG